MIILVMDSASIFLDQNIHAPFKWNHLIPNGYSWWIILVSFRIFCLLWWDVTIACKRKAFTFKPYMLSIQLWINTYCPIVLIWFCVFKAPSKWPITFILQAEQLGMEMWQRNNYDLILEFFSVWNWTHNLP